MCGVILLNAILPLCQSFKGPLYLLPHTVRHDASVVGAAIIVTPYRKYAVCEKGKNSCQLHPGLVSVSCTARATIDQIREVTSP